MARGVETWLSMALARRWELGRTFSTRKKSGLPLLITHATSLGRSFEAVSGSRALETVFCSSGTTRFVASTRVKAAVSVGFPLGRVVTGARENLSKVLRITGAAPSTSSLRTTGASRLGLFLALAAKAFEAFNSHSSAIFRSSGG